MNLLLVEPTIEEYNYEQKLLSDPETMSYNAGYEVTYQGYHYNTGCIDFPEENWEAKKKKREQKNCFFAYLKDLDLNQYVGYVDYNYNEEDQRYECGIVIEACHRGKGYAKKGLELLKEYAFSHGIEALYDGFETNRGHTLSLFQSCGFEIVQKDTWKKFGKNQDGVLVCCKKDKQ